MTLIERVRKFDCATPDPSETAVHFHETEASMGKNRPRGSRERAPVYVQCKLKDNDEVAHQQLPSTINFDSVAAQQVIMVSLPPNHNTPGPPPVLYFPLGSILSQILLVPAAATAFIDFNYMAWAQRLRADYLNRFPVSLRTKCTRTPVLCFVLLLRFERDNFRKTKGATPPR